CLRRKTLCRLIGAARTSPVRAACSTQRRLIAGSIPGKAASTGETWVFGSAPKAVAAPENSLALATIWAWVSRPITTSHCPVRPWINAGTTTFADAARASCVLRDASLWDAPQDRSEERRVGKGEESRWSR